MLIAFQVLYTKHKTQKSKLWFDGSLKYNEENQKVSFSNNQHCYHSE